MVWKGVKKGQNSTLYVRERGEFMDSYEHDTAYLLHNRYYRKSFFRYDDEVKKEEYIYNDVRMRYMRNVYWLIDKLAWDGIRYEDHIHREGNKGCDRCTRYYKGVTYDMRKGEDAVKLYNAITGKNEPCITAEEYARRLKERKMKHEECECNMGRD